MSMAYVRAYYGVPARRGGRLRLTTWNGQTRDGTIVSSPGAYIGVRFDDDTSRRTCILHPTCGIEYLPWPQEGIG